MPRDPSTPPRFSERGVAMVEFAVVLPVLAMLVVGVVEFELRVRARTPPPILDSLLIVSGVKAMYRWYSVLESLPPGRLELPRSMAMVWLLAPRS
jgi:hypothetical protein